MMSANDKTRDTSSPQFQKVWAMIVARSWADPDFKRRVIADPKYVLREYGIELSEDVNLKILDTAPNLGTTEQLAGSIQPVPAASYQPAPGIPGANPPTYPGYCAFPCFMAATRSPQPSANPFTYAGYCGGWGPCYIAPAPGGMPPANPPTSGISFCRNDSVFCVVAAAPNPQPPADLPTSGWVSTIATPPPFGACYAGGWSACVALCFGKN